jgi:AraC-like DNA-binding protein
MPTRLVDTRDIDEARSRIADVYCDHRLEIDRPRRRFHAVQTETVFGPLAVHHLAYGADVTARAHPLDSWVLVSTPTRGSLTVRHGREEIRVGRGEVAVIPPDAPFTLLWEDDCRLRTVRLRREVVEGAAVAAGWRPGTALHFDSAAGRGGTGAGWNRLIDYVARGPASPVAGPSAAIDETLEQHVAATLVAGLGLRGTGLVDSPAGVAPRRIRAVVDHMVAHSDRHLSTEELAAVAHVSPRALHESFRRHLGTTPTLLLRDLRLDRAHEVLLASHPDDGTSVAAVAHRCGFGNLGRFARWYADRFAELPSQTLAR